MSNVCFSRNERMSHSHLRGPSLILIDPKDPFKKVNERVHCVELTLLDNQRLHSSLLR